MASPAGPLETGEVFGVGGVSAGARGGPGVPAPTRRPAPHLESQGIISCIRDRWLGAEAPSILQADRDRGQGVGERGQGRGISPVQHV